MADKDIKKLRREATRQGWTEIEKKKGWLLLSPDGITKVMVHKTASDHRAIDNAVSLMRDGGFEWEGR